MSSMQRDLNMHVPIILSLKESNEKKQYLWKLDSGAAVSSVGRGVVYKPQG